MDLLLDTCTFLWIANEDGELTSKICSEFSNPENRVFLSSVSYWEILIKYRLKRLKLPEAPAQFVPKFREKHRIESLALQEEAVTQLARLPNYHKDPFDRILVCQAIAHGLIIATPDPHIVQYPVRTVW